MLKALTKKYKRQFTYSSIWSDELVIIQSRESLGQTSKKVSKSSKSKDTSIKLFDEQRAYFNHSFHLPSVLIKSVHVIYLVSSDTHSSNNMWGQHLFAKRWGKISSI